MITNRSLNRLFKNKNVIFRSLCSTNADIVVEKLENNIVKVNLNRHNGKNSLSKSMIKEFNAIISQLNSDQLTKVVIFNSTVEKVFCAGADLKERLSMPDNEVGEFVTGLRDSFERVAQLPMPTIAVINGVALGGGLELALACDIRLATESSLLGLPETALAIIPGAGGTQRLSRVVGISKAKEMIYLGSRLSGKQAENIGLVNECIADPLKRAIEIAQIIAEKGPIATRLAKKALDKGFDSDLKTGLEIEKECYSHVVYTQDRKEGLLSFTEKRKPVYSGN